MDLALKGKNCLVTASSKGLGFSVARALLREGAKVLVSSSDPANLKRAAEKLKAEGLTAFETKPADLTRADDIRRLIDYAYETFGRLHGVVTNCGGPPAGPPLQITDEQWQTAFDAVLLSVVRICRLVVPRMVKDGGGAIVAIASTSVKQPIEALTTSNALRPALAGFLKYLSSQVAAQGVRINTVAPGRFETDRTLEVDAAAAKASGRTPEEVRADSIAAIPMSRLGSLDEFADLCLFLLSERASYLTGQTVCIDGGRVQSVW